MKTLCEEYLDVLEQYDWRVVGYTDDDCVEIETWTPAGENLAFCVSLNNFQQDIEQQYCDFDVDEHVEMWIAAKNSGVPGVPSVRELVEDAEWIDKMLEELDAAFEALC